MTIDLTIRIYITPEITEIILMITDLKDVQK